MAIKKYYREGTTDPVNIILYSRGSPAPITGYTSVAIFLKSGHGSAVVEKVTSDGGVTVNDAAAGDISVQFAEDDLLYANASYSGYVLVVDGSGNRASFPENEEFVFIMRPRYSNDD
jgi:hypothetical protein